jgi:hypothetical protein
MEARIRLWKAPKASCVYEACVRAAISTSTGNFGPQLEYELNHEARYEKGQVPLPNPTLQDDQRVYPYRYK